MGYKSHLSARQQNNISTCKSIPVRLKPPPPPPENKTVAQPHPHKTLAKSWRKLADKNRSVSYPKKDMYVFYYAKDSDQKRIIIITFKSRIDTTPWNKYEEIQSPATYAFTFTCPVFLAKCDYTIAKSVKILKWNRQIYKKICVWRKIFIYNFNCHHKTVVYDLAWF